jgi:hypothetical protein
MNPDMNEFERIGSRRTGQSLANHASTNLKFSSNITRAMTFGPISTAC